MTDDSAREEAWRAIWPNVARSPLYDKGWDAALAWQAAQPVFVADEDERRLNGRALVTVEPTP